MLCGRIPLMKQALLLIITIRATYSILASIFVRIQVSTYLVPGVQLKVKMQILPEFSNF